MLQKQQLFQIVLPQTQLSNFPSLDGLNDKTTIITFFLGPAFSLLLAITCSANVIALLNINANHVSKFKSSPLSTRSQLSSESSLTQPIFPSLLSSASFYVLYTQHQYYFSKLNIYLYLCSCFLLPNFCASKPISTSICSTFIQILFKCHIWNRAAHKSST